MLFLNITEDCDHENPTCSSFYTEFFKEASYLCILMSVYETNQWEFLDHSTKLLDVMHQSIPSTNIPPG